jgi:cytidine deaminase
MFLPKTINMHKEGYNFSFEIFDSVNELERDDASLLEEAKLAVKLAYAPYSGFRVSAVAKLKNGKTITGTNQENASYPVGICAERVLLSAISSVYPGIPVDTIAVSYESDSIRSDHPISPCGICRQTLCEYEERQKSPIRLILSGREGKVFIIGKAGYLLPLAFTAGSMV